MNTTTPQVFRLGIFVLTGLLVLAIGIFLIGNKKNMFSSTYSVYGIFRNAGGLKVGNNVRFGGVDIGTVKTIHILKDTVVRVDIVIQTKMSEFIKADAIASVGSDGLMGDKLLEIEPGSPAAPLLTDGSQIHTTEPTDYKAMIAKFTTVANNAAVISGALADMSLQIKNGDGSISRLLYHNDLELSMERAMDNASKITGSLNGIAMHIQSGGGSLGSLIYTDSLTRGLNRVVAGAGSALATVQTAADNFSENMRALQGNYFFKSYFKKKAKAKADSVTMGPEDDGGIDDAQLEQIRADAEKELQRRHQKSNVLR
jgi:phospholipid/cholesterol/gamma-HCH transport system substrate-binding protein